MAVKDSTYHNTDIPYIYWVAPLNFEHNLRRPIYIRLCVMVSLLVSSDRGTKIAKNYPTKLIG